jgi:hypothetical protein
MAAATRIQSVPTFLNSLLITLLSTLCVDGVAESAT